MHCGVEVTESSTNKQHHLSIATAAVAATVATSSIAATSEMSIFHS
jgi:hypothetical protein